MAKPEHTAYQIQADFGGTNNIKDYIIRVDGDISGLDPSCIKNNQLRSNPFHSGERILTFSTLENGHITFGFDAATQLLNQARRAAKQDFKKGERPTFFLRKLTMSDFMAHKHFKAYKNNPLVRSLYKKYMLLAQLRDGGFQTS